MAENTRTSQGRKAKTSFLIADAQSVSTTSHARDKGYDAGKKVSGIKRHIMVDINGIIQGIEVTTANVTDRNGAIQLLKRHQNDLLSVVNVLCDGGYTGAPFSTKVQSLINATVEVVKRSELHKFVVLPKRWVVERTFSWLENFRRLWKNCEKSIENSRQSIWFAGIAILLKRY